MNPDTVLKVEVEVTDQEKARLERVANRPPLSEILNLHDFEVRFFHLPDALFNLSFAVGHRSRRASREGMGVLQLSRRRRDHQPRETRGLPQDMVATTHPARRHRC